MGRQQQRRRQQQQRRRQQQQPARPRGRQQQQSQGVGRWAIAGGVAVILIVIVGLYFAFTHQPSATPGATATPAQLARAVDGIQCNSTEMLSYHIHQHITLVDHGNIVRLPSSIGMPGGEANASCYYWIHVHYFSPNIIHVESPNAKIYSLGNFFDIWKATASSAQPPGDAFVTKLESAARRGQVTIFLNGKRWTKGYRTVPLRNHYVITVEIGKPIIPPRPFTDWARYGV